jgi:lipid-binding SYLF domain-containing protein
MEITLENYEHTCPDGCCYTSGYDVFIDGEKIGFTVGEDAQDLVIVLNEYFNS